MYPARLKRLQAALAQAHLDYAVAIAGPNLFYLTGLSFHLSERPSVGFFPQVGDPVLVVGNLEESKIKTGASYPLRWFTYTDSDGPAGAFVQAAQALPLRGRVGVETRRMRVMEVRFIEAAAPGLTIEPAEEIFAALRMTKDAAELQAMRQAVVIAEKALEATLPKIKVGMTERQVATELILQTLLAGSDGELPFTPIIASGPNGALPHATVTDRPLQSGDLVTIDWGAAYGGYMADLTRTFAIGEVNAEMKKIYELVKQANAAAKAHAKPGVTCASVDAAARQVIADGGYGDYFMHRVGHGLGMEGHEDPSMHGKNEMLLTEGVTFTIEPGIYLSGQGGARIEDDMVVTAAGCESLSSLPRELQVIG